MTRWYKEKKKEHYYKEAKRKGYRARSAFKLKQIHKRFTIFSSGDTVIDLGAAPGGWSQVAKEYIGIDGTIIAADMHSIQPIDHVKFIQGDITEKETVEKIKHLVSDRKADIVLSDMSPDISGNYSLDHARSIWLCKQALHVAKQLLTHRGTFVCKIFEGADTKEFIGMVNRLFITVKLFSPQASRKSSSEIYIIAKTLKKIPPYSKQ
jgi:23S rRNA (uridine2552-2'-O)-methyltransferase